MASPSVGSPGPGFAPEDIAASEGIRQVMPVHTHQFSVETRGGYDMHDITGEVQNAIRQSGCSEGIATAYVRHTTATILIGEYEPGLIDDIPIPVERIAPRGEQYRHNVINADDNAHSHLVGSVMGPSETVPFTGGRLMLGTWQSVILLELDPHPRTRNVVVQIIGE